MGPCSNIPLRLASFTSKLRDSASASEWPLFRVNPPARPAVQHSVNPHHVNKRNQAVIGQTLDRAISGRTQRYKNSSPGLSLHLSFIPQQLLQLSRSWPKCLPGSLPTSFMLSVLFNEWLSSLVFITYFVVDDAHKQRRASSSTSHTKWATKTWCNLHQFQSMSMSTIVNTAVHQPWSTLLSW
jgi:hypothetical protein